MLLALQLGLGLHLSVARRFDHSGTAVRQFPVVIEVVAAPLAFDLVVVIPYLVQAGHSALTFQATHTVNDDECYQCQPQNDQPFSKFHGSTCLSLGRHAGWISLTA